MNVFMRKKQEDSKKSIVKVLDFKKDYQQRLKHLRFVVDNCDHADIYNFFNGNLAHSHIYTLFFEAFSHVEVSLKQKDRVTRQHRDELESVLYIFEKILVYLPELIRQRWQVNSIGFVMAKLLHPGNSLRCRKQAMRLFMLWYQILGNSASDVHHATFATLVPGFHYRGSPSVKPLTDPSYGGGVKSSGLVGPAESGPLLPTQTAADGFANQVGAMCLDYLLTFMVTEKSRIYWGENREQKAEECFFFLFEMFKKHYLVQLFPKFSWKTNLFDPVLDLPDIYMVGGSSPRRTFLDTFSPSSPDHAILNAESLEEMQVTFIQWLCTYVHSGLESGGNAKLGGAMRSAFMPLTRTSSNPGTNEDSESSVSSHHSANSPLVKSGVAVPLAAASWCDVHNTAQHLSVRRVLFSTRENVNLIHEIFRQAFIMGPSHFQAIRIVISVYRDWIMSYETPTFVLEPIGAPINSAETGAREEVRAGLQKTLQIFILHSCAVFLAEMPLFRPDMLDHQEELCKRVLNNYRYMVMNTPMSPKTWELLLQTLLHLISATLKEKPPPQKRDSLGGRLAAALFQTLLVTWIRANLNVTVSTDLWDRLLTLLSSLVEWSELIEEWGKTMETLTRVLAKHVYCLDMENLPLDRLSEMTNRKRHARINQQLSGGGGTIGSKSGTLTASGGGSNAGSAGSRNVWSRPAPTSVNVGRPTGPGPGTIPIPQSQQYTAANPQDSSATGSYDSRDSNQRGSHDEDHTPRRRSIVRSSSSMHSNSRIKRSVSDCVLEEKERLIAFHRQRLLLRRISRSLETLSTSDDTSGSRSTSPSPSSGHDSASIKEAPLQIDLSSGGGDSILSIGDPFESAKSVMAGGSLTGWHPDATVVLWRRMLGILGNINAIPNADLHARAFEILRDITEALIKMRNNLSVSEDNQSTPPPPPLVPPISFVSPWCFKAIELPSKYQRGRLIAYGVLCKITLRRQQDIPLPKEYFMKFYHVVHLGLTSEEQEVVNTLVKACGPAYLSLGLPGSSLLHLDLIQACSTIANGSEFKGVPRTEALTILGVILCMPPPFRQVPVLHPSRGAQMSVVSSIDLKDIVLEVLLKSGRREPAGLSRCIALCALGLYIFEEVQAERPPQHQGKLREAIATLLFALKITTPALSRQSGLHSQFQAKNVAQVAADLCLLLAEMAPELEASMPDIVNLLLEALCTTLQATALNPDLSGPETQFATTVLLALGEWTTRLSPGFLLEPNQTKSAPLLLILRAIISLGESDQIPSSGSVSSQPSSIGSDRQTSFSSDTSAGSKRSYRERAQSVSNPGGNLPDQSPLQRPPSFVAKSEMQHSTSTLVEPSPNKKGVATAARALTQLLIGQLSHFPMGLGASHLGSLVIEPDDATSNSPQHYHPHHQGMTPPTDLTSALFRSPSLQFLLVDGGTVMSVHQLPPGANPLENTVSSMTICPGSSIRVLTRDVCGKFAWDLFPLQPTKHDRIVVTSRTTGSPNSVQNSTGASGDAPGKRLVSTTQAPAARKFSNTRGDRADVLEDMLENLGKESPELLPKPGRSLVSPSGPPRGISADLEEQVLTNVLNQKTLLLDYLNRKKKQSVSSNGSLATNSVQSSDDSSHSSTMAKKYQLPGHMATPPHPFLTARSLLAQLGFLTWEARKRVDLLRKNEGFLRQLRNLDQMRGREKHKVAVIFVGPGQEDKQSILSNSGGSQLYEEFVAGLGWEVELESHVGFMGGLLKNKSTGETAPYYSTPFMEVIFHVSTRMGPVSHESITHLSSSGVSDPSVFLQKTRHLGNDEVHIVWSEHSRDYRRGIIPTEFCDVLIGLYPLSNGLIRVQITRKPEVPFFGPLFDGVLLPPSRLPALVRATAINASRAIKTANGRFIPLFVEREKALGELTEYHKIASSFERCAAQLFSPVELPYLNQNQAWAKESVLNESMRSNK